jgi:hypothetical protein
MFATAMLALAVLTRAAISAQDRDNLNVPGGLAFSEFKGYEDWPVVAVQHADDLVKVVLGKSSDDGRRRKHQQGWPRRHRDPKERIYVNRHS